MNKLTTFQIITLCTASIIVLVILLHTFFDQDGWQQRQKVRDDLRQLEEQNMQLESQIKSLKNEVHALRTNPQYQEHTIRKELGFVKKDDIIIELPPDAMNVPQTPKEKIKK